MTFFDDLDEGFSSPPSPAGKLDLAGRLNSSQLAAATYDDGPLLIVAGAGSGKTRTLVHRVAYLIDQGVPPAAILLLTFTRKAAQEMLGRAIALVGPRAAQVSGGTFHSLANSLLRVHAPLLGYVNGFSLMDQDDAESLVGRIRAEQPEAKRKNFPSKKSILGLLSQARSKDRPLLELTADSAPHLLEYVGVIEKIAVEYAAHKLKNALMDFDDLLFGLEAILSQNEDLRQRIAGRYHYILVDEYQDTNPIQARLTHLLGRDHLQVTAVGDDAQSIYAFRGASFRNIMDFPKIFPGAKIMKLEENYRSQEPIVTLANHLIAEAREKYDKTLISLRGEGDAPQLVAVEDQGDEAAWVVAKIMEYMEEGVELSEMAILFRASSHSIDLEVELIKRNLPFTKYGGLKFLESAHIKDFLAALKVAANPADSLSLQRLLQMVEGIGLKGATDLALWVDGQREHLTSLSQAPVKPKVQKNLAPLAELLAQIGQKGQELAPRVKAVYNYYNPLVKDLYPDDWPDRQSDLKELCRLAESRTNLQTFLDEVTLDPPSSKANDPDGQNRAGLTLSTIHSAKGLEWKVVFLLSALEGRFPASFAMRSDDEIEEERRLMYVAVTRAADKLFIMMPLGLFDRRTGLPGQPSRFLAGLPKEAGLNLSSKTYLNESLNSDPKIGYDNKVAYFSKPSYSSNFSSAAKAPFKARAASPPAALATELSQGQRVSHPVYGIGLVLEVKGPKILIDFDHFGRKQVMMPYAKLTSV